MAVHGAATSQAHADHDQLTLSRLQRAGAYTSKHLTFHAFTLTLNVTPTVHFPRYLLCAWWGFVSADDRHRLEAFLRRSARLCYRADSSTTFASICDDADDQLFERMTGNSQHLLHRLLPAEREQHYSLRQRSHNYQLLERTTLLKDKNFIIRMLYKLRD